MPGRGSGGLRISVYQPPASRGLLKVQGSATQGPRERVSKTSSTTVIGPFYTRVQPKG